MALPNLAKREVVLYYTGKSAMSTIKVERYYLIRYQYQITSSVGEGLGPYEKVHRIQDIKTDAEAWIYFLKFKGTNEKRFLENPVEKFSEYILERVETREEVTLLG